MNATDQPAANDPQYRDAMKRYQECPVCGKGKSEPRWAAGRLDPVAEVPVSHIACVLKLEAELEAMKVSANPRDAA